MTGQNMATTTKKLGDPFLHPESGSTPSPREVEGKEQRTHDGEGSEHHHSIRGRDIVRIAFVAAAAAALWFLRAGPSSI